MHYTDPNEAARVLKTISTPVGFIGLTSPTGAGIDQPQEAEIEGDYAYHRVHIQWTDPAAEAGIYYIANAETLTFELSRDTVLTGFLIADSPTGGTVRRCYDLAPAVRALAGETFRFLPGLLMICSG